MPVCEICGGSLSKIDSRLEGGTRKVIGTVCNTCNRLVGTLTKLESESSNSEFGIRYFSEVPRWCEYREICVRDGEAFGICHSGFEEPLNLSAEHINALVENNTWRVIG